MDLLTVIKWQFWILLLGTGFAWVNVLLEAISWMKKEECKTSCDVKPKHPLSTPCFYGAVFFTVAFILSAIILSSSS